MASHSGDRPAALFSAEPTAQTVTRDRNSFAVGPAGHEEKKSRRWIVLHADDFGMSAAANAGILQSFRAGLLTSTSLLANAPGAEAACAAWPILAADVRAGSIASVCRRRSLGDDLRPFDVGVHLNLTQGRPLSTAYPVELLNERGQFPGIGPVFRRLHAVGTCFRDGVMSELQLQIERLLDCGIQPTHLNGHQYVELLPGVAELIPQLVMKYSIPTIRVAQETQLFRTVLMDGRAGSYVVALIKRYFAGRFRRLPDVKVLAAPARFFGTAHAGLVRPGILRHFLRSSSLTGCTEIGLHPAITESNPRPESDEWFDPLAVLRPVELEWLCDEATCEIIASNGQQLGRLCQVR